MFLNDPYPCILAQNMMDNGMFYMRSSVCVCGALCPIFCPQCTPMYVCSGAYEGMHTSCWNVQCAYIIYRHDELKVLL